LAAFLQRQEAIGNEARLCKDEAGASRLARMGGVVVGLAGANGKPTVWAVVRRK
jgi:hypothetical protein